MYELNMSKAEAHLLLRAMNYAIKGSYAMSHDAEISGPLMRKINQMVLNVLEPIS